MRLGGTACQFSRLTLCAIHKDKVINLQRLPIQSRRRDQKTMCIHACRKAALGADQQALTTTAVHEISERPAEFSLPRRSGLGGNRIKIDASLGGQFQLVIVQVVDRTDLVCLHECLAGKLECFETLERIIQAVSSNNHAVIFQNDALTALRKGRRDVVAQLLGARACIGCKSDFAANGMSLMKQSRIGCHAANAERYQSDRVRVDNCLNVGSDLIDRLMKGELRRRRMWAFGGSIGMDANDIASRQIAFVDAGGRNPNVAIWHHESKDCRRMSSSFGTDRSDPSSA